MNRRDSLARAGSLAVVALGGNRATGQLIAPPASDKKVAAIVTTYHRYSHADNLVTRFMEGYSIVGESYPPPFDVCLRKPLAAELRYYGSNGVGGETVAQQKCRERQPLVHPQCHAPCALLNQLRHYGLEYLDFGRPGRLVVAPWIGKIKHAGAGQGSGIHAAAIHHRLAEPAEPAPDVGVIGFGAVRQVENLMFIIG